MAFATPLVEGLQIGVYAGAATIDINEKCYQARAVEYNDFLEFFLMVPQKTQVLLHKSTRPHKLTMKPTH